ncbi:MAG: hypothetical protein J6Z11_13270 [Candidatus Riflebacteria bacterium]|nr:hypothetical protein [Candidatus Riflebacteria bacterium]
MPLLSQKVVVLAKIESQENVDALPVASTDAILVSNVSPTVETQELERNTYRKSLSTQASVIGRKTAQITFDKELKGSGVDGVAPEIGKLLRACGMSETYVPNTVAATISDAEAGAGNTGTATFSKVTAPLDKKNSKYVVYCAEGGNSSSAQFVILPPDDDGVFPSGDDSVLQSLEFSASSTDSTASFTFAGNLASKTLTLDDTTYENNTTVTVTVGGVKFTYQITEDSAVSASALASALASVIAEDRRFTGTSATNGVINIVFAGNAAPFLITSEITLGDSGAVVQGSATGNFAAGDKFTFALRAPGYHYTPVSSGFESLTIYCYLDGLLHKMTGCRGTVSFSGEAGNYGTASFTFMGQYHPVVDAEMPEGAVYELTAPHQIELAGLVLDSYRYACAQSFSIDLGMTNVVRDCMNGSDGYDGIVTTARSVTGSVNPEAVLEADFNVWERFANGEIGKFYVCVGVDTNNKVEFISNSVQYNSVAYGDRNNIRTYDVGMKFVGASGDGDDELEIVFS